MLTEAGDLFNVDMVDLASQAFSSKNYDLAAEIYERSISENGPKSEYLLGLADSLAKGGNFSKAFGAYAKAYRVDRNISVTNLKHLVTALVNSVKQENIFDLEMNTNVIFDCLLCRNLLNDPVTIPCGHTFCRSCLQKEPSKQCRSCKKINHYFSVSRSKSNIVLSQTIEKWFPNHCKAVRLKKDANKAVSTQKFEKAVKLYSEALEMAPTDHLLWSNRSHAYANLEKFKDALHDADTVLNLRPDWPKGYFRRGCALYGLSRYEESVVALLQCLALDSSIETAKDYLSKALHSILAPLSPDDPKSVELQRQLNPSLLDRLIHSNFNTSLLLPTITVDTVRQLKEIITDTVVSASSFLESQTVEQTNVIKNPTPLERSPISQSLSELPGISELPGSYHHLDQPTHSRSTPSSRSGSPSLGKRRHSDFVRITNDCENGGNTSSEEVAMVTNAKQNTSEDAEVKMIMKVPDVNKSLLDKAEFECSLCYRLLYQPVTTQCGHSFCRQCLDRVLDHKTECPLCKSNLSEYLAERRQSVTSAVENLLVAYFPEDNETRHTQHEEEMAELASMGRDTQHEIPVFVCTTAYPSVPCPLHIFEPKYRLMVRQCMESGQRQFGMCIATGDRTEDFSDFGCMLEIRDVQFFPDGRSLVDTIGGKRFKVISRGHREGYCTAKVEYLQDVPIENPEEVKTLSEKVYTICKTWADSLTSSQQQQIQQHIGECPPADHVNFGINGPTWHWWMIGILPLDPRIQIAMLAMTSYKERLQGLHKVLGYLKNKRDSK